MVNEVVEFEEDRRIAWQTASAEHVHGLGFRRPRSGATSSSRSTAARCVRETWDISQEKARKFIGPRRARRRARSWRDARARIERDRYEHLRDRRVAGDVGRRHRHLLHGAVGERRRAHEREARAAARCRASGPQSTVTGNVAFAAHELLGLGLRDHGLGRLDGDVALLVGLRDLESRSDSRPRRRSQVTDGAAPCAGSSSGTSTVVTGGRDTTARPWPRPAWPSACWSSSAAPATPPGTANSAPRPRGRRSSSPAPRITGSRVGRGGAIQASRGASSSAAEFMQ